MREAAPSYRSRLLISINSGSAVVEPGKGLTFVVPRAPHPDGRPLKRFKPERLYISPPSYDNDGAEWRIKNLWIDDIPQLEHGESGRLFGHKTIRIESHVNWFPILEPQSQIALDVVNESDKPSAFYGGLVGSVPASDVKSAEICGPLRVRDLCTGDWIPGVVTGPPRVRPGESAEYALVAKCDAFCVDKIEIERRSKSWIVEDIVVGDRSQMLQSGAIPADMFASNSIDMFVQLETVQTRMPFKMKVRYIGDEERGERFYGATLHSQVAR